MLLNLILSGTVLSSQKQKKKEKTFTIRQMRS